MKATHVNRTKFTSSENYRLAPPWWPCPLPVNQTECKQNRGSCFLSRYEKQARVKVTLRLTVSQSVLVSSPVWCSWRDISVLSMWGALSDERTGLSFVRVIVSSKSIVSIYTYLHFIWYQLFICTIYTRPLSVQAVSTADYALFLTKPSHNSLTNRSRQ
jgi:hypothetical protein